MYYCLDKANDIYAFGLRSSSLKGYMLNTGTVSAGVSVNGAATCTAIGKTWVNDATTFVVQGYTGSPAAWSASWNWSK